ncbi:MAG: thioredoxin-like domain-containing protein [Candidatus Brocadiaceae bacterium]|nr:thioredoxin-like domain-containing protein [Candidatus Brocadiaceae bacterium]
MKTSASPRIKAPEFPEGMEWLNTDRPLRVADLRGKFVLLDFWTYCCINCMHVIPELKRLEKGYPAELVVIGVHSAKFPNERLTENIRQAILRYEIQHPVVNDKEMQIWWSYAVRSWPTLVLIDPEGYVTGVYSGEGNYEAIDRRIREALPYFRSRGVVEVGAQHIVPLHLERDRLGPSPLSFPGKILADPIKDRLFISDSNHNRIVIVTGEGRVIDVAGSGEIGRQDGSFSQASFFHPQGMALQGETLYVADTENHLIRRLDLQSGTVTTLAGTGRQGGFLSLGGLGTKAELNSPWDLCLVGDRLYIAMAGSHQVWVMDLANNLVQPFAGSGREGRADGSLEGSAFAQPSGITTDGRRLFVADSETSSVREINLLAGRVNTIVGLDLFEFGDVDGQGAMVRLQHPLGVVFHEGLLYVADTYNHKIKVIDPEKKTSRTLLGDGRPGYRDGREGRFYEPGGLTFGGEGHSQIGGRLYVADTNNHAIRIMKSDGKVETLRLTGLKPTEARPAVGFLLPGAKEINLPPQTLPANSTVELVIDLHLPEGYHLSPLAPFLYSIDPGGSLVTGREKEMVGAIHELPLLEGQGLPVRIPFKTPGATPEFPLKVSVTFYYCREDNQGVCLADSVVWSIPIKLLAQGETVLRLEYTASRTF